MERVSIPDKYDGPSAKQIAMYQKWVRVKSISRNMVIALYNNATTCLLPLRKLLKKSNNDDNINDDNGKKLAYTQETIPPNTPRIVDTLMRVHGYQLLLDGLFNADPHGGNFLLLPDGRIGLIEITDRPNDYWRTNA